MVFKTNNTQINQTKNLILPIKVELLPIDLEHQLQSCMAVVMILHAHEHLTLQGKTHFTSSSISRRQFGKI